jgi:hypothetical protein
MFFRQKQKMNQLASPCFVGTSARPCTRQRADDRKKAPLWCGRRGLETQSGQHRACPAIAVSSRSSPSTTKACQDDFVLFGRMIAYILLQCTIFVFIGLYWVQQIHKHH